MATTATRVLFSSYTADWTGPTHSLLLLLKALRARYDVAVLLPGTGLLVEALRAEQIRHHVFPSLDKWSIPAIVRLVRRERPALLYANNTDGTSRNAILAARLTGVGSICHVRATHWGTSWRRLWYLRLCSAVVAVSRATAQSVQRFVDPARLFVVHNGVDVETLERGAAAGPGVRQELGLPEHAPLALNVSHVCPRKGQQYLVEVAERMRRAVPEAHLCIVGSLDRDPDYVRRFRAQLARRGLDRCVHLLGFRTDVPRILGEASVYVHSAVADPHPRAVIEAMAARLPVVAFAVDGVAETVHDGTTGRLVDRGDTEALASALVELIRDPALRRRMGDQGRARTHEHFSAGATAERVGDIIGSVIGARSGRA